MIALFILLRIRGSDLNATKYLSVNSQELIFNNCEDSCSQKDACVTKEEKHFLRHKIKEKDYNLLSNRLKKSNGSFVNIPYKIESSNLQNNLKVKQKLRSAIPIPDYNNFRRNRITLNLPTSEEFLIYPEQPTNQNIYKEENYSKSQEIDKLFETLKTRCPPVQDLNPKNKYNTPTLILMKACESFALSKNLVQGKNFTNLTKKEDGVYVKYYYELKKDIELKYKVLETHKKFKIAVRNSTMKLKNSELLNSDKCLRIKTENIVRRIFKAMKIIDMATRHYTALLNEVSIGEKIKYKDMFISEFEKVCHLRDSLLFEIDETLKDIEIKKFNDEKLENFQCKIEKILGQFYKVSEDISSITIKLGNHIHTNEDYIFDFKLRMFEYLFALVFIEKYKIEVENKCHKKICKIESFEDIPFPFENELFMNDSSEAFADNEYIKIIWKFKDELEKYLKVPFLLTSGSLQKSFKSFIEIIKEISDNENNEFICKIYKSKIFDFVGENITTVEDLEYVLLQGLDRYTLIN